MIILERFEGDWAVLEMDGTIFQIPVRLLPPDAGEGMCIGMDVYIDDAATREREEAIRKMFDQFF